MKSKFTSLSPRMAERAKEELGDVMKMPVSPVAPKVQKAGAAGAIAKGHTQALPIERTMFFHPKHVRVRPGFERSEDEYADAAFEELKASIKEMEGNVQPIDVRLIQGVPGFEAELLAGTRRLRACQELGLKVTANVRVCDEFMADKIHETENKARKNKAPYSRGRQYQAMLASGRYESQTDLAEKLNTRRQEISEFLRLVEDAPPGMWDKVTNPGTLNTLNARTVAAAYGVPAFAEALAQVDRLSVSELVALAARAIKPPPTKVDQTRLARRGKNFVVLLPAGISEAVAKRAMDAAAKVADEAKK